MVNDVMPTIPNTRHRGAGDHQLVTRTQLEGKTGPRTNQTRCVLAVISARHGNHASSTKVEPHFDETRQTSIDVALTVRGHELWFDRRTHHVNSIARKAQNIARGIRRKGGVREQAIEGSHQPGSHSSLHSRRILDQIAIGVAIRDDVVQHAGHAKTGFGHRLGNHVESDRVQHHLGAQEPRRRRFGQNRGTSQGNGDDAVDRATPFTIVVRRIHQYHHVGTRDTHGSNQPDRVTSDPSSARGGMGNDTSIHQNPGRRHVAQLRFEGVEAASMRTSRRAICRSIDCTAATAVSASSRTRSAYPKNNGNDRSEPERTS